MKGVPALYNGKLVSKENFRTFIYSPDGSQKLVESWEAFEQHMETGIWFARRKDALSSKMVETAKTVEKQRRGRKPKATEAEQENAEIEESNTDILADENIDTDSNIAFEIKPDDDFLPKQ